MKKHMIAAGLSLVLLTATFGLVRADPTFSSSGNKTLPNVYNHPDEGTKLRPRFTGVFVAAAHDGFQLLNPVAPKEYGDGERFAAQPMHRYSQTLFLEGPTGMSQTGPNVNRDTGGIKLFGWEF